MIHSQQAGVPMIARTPRLQENIIEACLSDQKKWQTCPKTVLCFQEFSSSPSDAYDVAGYLSRTITIKKHRPYQAFRNIILQQCKRTRNHASAAAETLPPASHWVKGRHTIHMCYAKDTWKSRMVNIITILSTQIRFRYHSVAHAGWWIILHQISFWDTR